MISAFDTDNQMSKNIYTEINLNAKITTFRCVHFSQYSHCPLGNYTRFTFNAILGTKKNSHYAEFALKETDPFQTNSLSQFYLY